MAMFASDPYGDNMMTGITKLQPEREISVLLVCNNQKTCLLHLHTHTLQSI
jgi:hypothetical protein